MLDKRNGKFYVKSYVLFSGMKWASFHIGPTILKLCRSTSSMQRNISYTSKKLRFLVRTRNTALNWARRQKEWGLRRPICAWEISLKVYLRLVILIVHVYFKQSPSPMYHICDVDKASELIVEQRHSCSCDPLGGNIITVVRRFLQRGVQDP